jgi:hypothetical protein
LFHLYNGTSNDEIMNKGMQIYLKALTAKLLEMAILILCL